MYHIQTDTLGTPRTITNATDGSLVWSWDNSEAFGNNSNTNTGLEFNLRFSGQYFDEEKGSSYNINRDYASGLGRYMQSDPIGLNGGINTYGYVQGNPLNAIDPMGLWSTNAHNELLDSMFPGLKPELMNMLKMGSAYTDSSAYQGSEYTHMHAMSNSVNKFSAFSNWCSFLENQRNLYVKNAQAGNFNKAFFELGMGLHAIMDSTSPAHEGFQYWGGLVDSGIYGYGFNHGDLIKSISKESLSKLTPEIKEKTVKLMNDYYLGNLKNCDCIK